MSDRILVTDGEQRAALAVVRSLGRAGHTCVVVSATGRSLAGASRFAHREERAPDALRDAEGFATRVEDLVRQHRIDVVLPVADPALFTLLDSRDRLAPAVLPFPPAGTVRAAADKHHVTALAGRHGIAVPHQVLATSRSEALALAGREIAFPLALKPVRSVTGQGADRVKVGVSLVQRPEALPAAVNRLPDAAFPVLVQQRITGDGVGVFLLLWQGETRAVFAHRRLREKPPSGGVSVYRESISADPALVARSRDLLDDLGWHGVAMVEYKLDRATGTPYLMEINGRFWGSLQLAIDAGVDFPSLLVDLARGRDPGPAPSWRTGLRSRWCWGDVDHLLARLRRSREELGLPVDAPGLGRVLWDVLLPWRPGDRHEVLRLSDPRPFLRESLAWFRGQ